MERINSCTDRQTPEISVIIPVHNGEKFLRKTVRNILQQTFENFELILVENGSADGSLGLCELLSAEDHRVITLQNSVRGTSLARKKGVQHARGKYIVFVDQDDTYLHNNAICEMLRAIKEDNVQICQFGHYIHYLLGLKRKINKTDKKQIYVRDSNYADIIGGVAGVPGSKFDMAVWNKIYDAEVLKSAVENIHTALYFAEDEYLNLLAFFDNKVQKISVRNDAFYVWDVGTGFSSTSKSGEALFRDYEIVKPMAVRLLAENNCSTDTLFNCHLESVYFFKVLIRNMITEGVSKETVQEKVRELNAYSYLEQAKAYFRQAPKERLWKELEFLSSEYTVEEYYEYCLNTKNKVTIRSLVRKILSIIK